MDKKKRDLFLASYHSIRLRRDFWAVEQIFRGIFKLRYPLRHNRIHLQAVMEWLCRAYDAMEDGGISGAYEIIPNTWYPPYPETTGYLIPTFFDYAGYSGNVIFHQRAIQLAAWLVSLQMVSGAFPGPFWITPDRQPVVFDTGQVVDGLLRAYLETGEEHILQSVIRAGEWLADVQEEDGSWCRFDMDRKRVFNARTAWVLVRVNQIHKAPKLLSAGLRNLDWVLSQQTSNGWYQNASFESDESPLTHTIAYTTEGLLEAGVLLSDQRMIDAAKLTADALLERQETDGYLKGTFDHNWNSEARWSCLTGAAQMALIWMRLFEITSQRKYLKASASANCYIKKVQSLKSRHPGIRGGIGGSYPIYGDYAPFMFINWAAKFFADSLMQEEKNLDVTQ